MPVKIGLLIIILLLPMMPTFWAIQDIPKRRFAERKKKILWFVLVSTIPCLGALFYILFVRKHTQLAENVDQVPEP